MPTELTRVAIVYYPKKPNQKKTISVSTSGEQDMQWISISPIDGVKKVLFTRSPGKWEDIELSQGIYAFSTTEQYSVNGGGSELVVLPTGKQGWPPPPPPPLQSALTGWRITWDQLTKWLNAAIPDAGGTVIDDSVTGIP